MADFVTDHRADAAIVDSVIRVRVEEGGLKDSCGEDDLIEHWMVVGVDSLGCHEPLCQVNGLPYFIQVPVHIGVMGTFHVTEEVCRVNLDGRVIDPLVGKTYLWTECVQLLQRLFFGVLAHPSQGRNTLPVGFDQVGDQRLHPCFVAGREVPINIDLADCFAKGRLDDGHPALPALFVLRGTAEGGAVEVKVRGNKNGIQVWRGRAENPECQPFLPRFQWLGFQQGCSPCKEVRSTHHNFIPLGLFYPCRLEPRVEQGEQCFGFLCGLEVVGLLGIPQSDVVPVVGCQGGFKGDDAL
ncbi:hypothetical protein D3C73_976530 [compost metagenome]